MQFYKLDKGYFEFTSDGRPVYRVSTIVKLAKAFADSQQVVPSNLSKYESLVLDYLHGISLMSYFGISTTKKPLTAQVYHYNSCKSALQYMAIQYYGILRYHVDADKWHNELVRGRRISGNMGEETVRSVHEQIMHYEKLFDLKPNGFPKDEFCCVNDYDLNAFIQLRYGVHQYLFVDSLEHLQDTIIPSASRRCEVDADFYAGHCPCFSVASMRKLGEVSQDFVKLMGDRKILIAY